MLQFLHDFVHVFAIGFGQFFIFFPCETAIWHLDSCPPEDTCYGVIPWVLRVLGQGLKSECADIFHQSFLWLLRHTDEPQKGRNSCLGYNPALFWVLSVSCWCLGELISRSTISIAVFCLQNLIRLHQFSAYTLIPKGWYSPIKVTGVLVGKFREHP